MEFSEYQITGIPETVYYIPEFLTPAEEDAILKKVYGAPKPKWTCLSNRRLQQYGGAPHEKGMFPEEIPSWLQFVINKVHGLSAFDEKKPNHVLVNEYLPGQGIMPHTDGPLFYPIISTVSCGSHTVLEFLENNDNRNKICEVLVEPRSLIVVKNDMYTKHLHCIRERKTDNINSCVNWKNNTSNSMNNKELARGVRVSLTIRHVPKVIKAKFII
ncbi:alpha-ketoglutarate-dependent dioxygenase alkB homolog 6 [Cylas formicarius]|uniref:alpha-ketoglutarate-dependent dioxygenase alkB homolog 6 n=1 Tax=Cylas formicarius TaxID=197179 RepID=UPI0029585EFF|nr:alpha-ketoglutarate-dependent dioxygenase alkB homolog 6 [Cylas formicarius]